METLRSVFFTSFWYNGFVITSPTFGILMFYYSQIKNVYFNWFIRVEQSLQSSLSVLNIYLISRRIKNEMKLVILDTSDDVTEWAAKYVVKRIQDFQPGEEKFLIETFYFCALKLKTNFQIFRSRPSHG